MAEVPSLFPMLGLAEIQSATRVSIRPGPLGNRGFRLVLHNHDLRMPTLDFSTLGMLWNGEQAVNYGEKLLGKNSEEKQYGRNCRRDYGSIRLEIAVKT
jgi:hypothetical protein